MDPAPIVNDAAMKRGGARPRLGRRAVLAAAAAGAAALAAEAIAAPTRALAANGDPLTVGGSFSGSSTTKIATTGADSFEGSSDAGAGVTGFTARGKGVYGYTSAGRGAGVVGENRGNHGMGTLGGPTIAVHATQGNASFALWVDGRAGFSRSGVLRILPGKHMGAVTGVPVTASTCVLATLQTYRSGVAIAAVVPQVGADRINVYLTKPATGSGATWVAWFAFERPLPA